MNLNLFASSNYLPPAFVTNGVIYILVQDAFPTPESINIENLIKFSHSK